MNAEGIDVAGLQVRLIQQLMQMCRDFQQGEVEDLAAIHEEHTVGDLQMRRAGTVGAELRLAQLPDRVFAHPGRSGGITEQHGGVAVFRVDDLRIRIGGDQQAVFQTRRFHEAFDRVDAVHIAGTTQGNIESGDMGRQAQLVLNDRSGVRQPFFITVLGDDDQAIDGFTFELGAGGEQRIGGFDTQVGRFLIGIHTRQKRRTDLAKDEGFVLVELCTLGVVINPGRRHVTRNIFYANHYGFPIINS
ncbi:hypothetical protein D3C86_1543610 [compost metagenome]